MSQSWPLFVYFRSFHIPVQMTNIQFEQYKLKKAWMEGADESTELWRHPTLVLLA